MSVLFCPFVPSFVFAVSLKPLNVLSDYYQYYYYFLFSQFGASSHCQNFDKILRRWRGLEKSHRRELARIVTVNNERAVRILKPSSKQKNSFERIPSRPGSACKFADWFSSVFQSLQMHCRVFCNLADSSSVNQIRKS